MDSEKPNKPGGSALKQQKLKSWNFSMNKRVLGIFYIISGCFFIIIGSIIVGEANSVIEHVIRYDNVDACEANWKTRPMCTIKLKLDEKMNSPIFVYYEISNMYQNHRRYNKSRDIKQLMGDTQSKSEISSYCDPIKNMNDLGFIVNNPYLDLKSVANPCGMMAKAYFNDTYTISPIDPDQAPVKIHFGDIAWGSDKDEKFKNNDNTNLQWIDVENQHFIVWMSTSGLPTFKKLWGKIEDDLPKGDYQILIENNYDVSDFSGHKSLIITTTSGLGGKMIFLGVISLVVGCLSFLGGCSIIGLTWFLQKKRGISLD